MSTFAGPIASCSELRDGDEIAAFQGDVRRFHGYVTDTMPDMELFWAVSPVGERRIIEFEEYKVTLLDSAEAQG
ncbi:hypothetical protein [Arthrobacter sp. Alg241-R88]|uniref:hypothetical protein n=1 Tax=Arthrobacter sp. Alg241-R88 TaxID=2305984 RepID=UPI0013D25115|nr:hypothetical protein [Arthrobacter sp. Alg241-R88]